VAGLGNIQRTTRMEGSQDLVLAFLPGWSGYSVGYHTHKLDARPLVWNCVQRASYGEPNPRPLLQEGRREFETLLDLPPRPLTSVCSRETADRNRRRSERIIHLVEMPPRCPRKRARRRRLWEECREHSEVPL